MNRTNLQQLLLLCGVGAAILYAGSTAFHLIGGSTNPTARIAWGLVFGTLTWAVLAVPVMLVLWLGWRTLGRRSGLSFTAAFVLLNGLLSLAVGAVLAWQFLETRPRTRFGKWVATPLPASVRNIRQGGFTAMDNELRVLVFEVNEGDLQTILRLGAFSFTNQFNSNLWKDRLQQFTALNVDFSPSWRAYVAKVDRGEKYLFCSPTGTNVVFVLDRH